jgi:hypothetical protein
LSARPKKVKVYVTKSLRDYVAGFRKIWSRLNGIECLIALFLYVLWAFTLSFWLRIILCRIFRGIRQTLVIEAYVAGSAILAIAVWLWVPTFWWAILCSYFLFSTVVVLLHVVLLSKVFGDIESAERSLILFMCNVVQLVFTFSIWYELKASQAKGEALLNAILVFGTLDYPHNANAMVVVAVQIVTDFLLLAIFLAHIVGRVGYRK